MTDTNLLQIPRLSNLQFASLQRSNDVEADDTLDTGELGEMGYQQTLMYGRYSRSLGDQVREEVKRQKSVEKRRKKEYRRRKRELR